MEGVRGNVPLVWSMRARFGFGLEPTSTRVQGGVPVRRRERRLAVARVGCGPGARRCPGGVEAACIGSAGDEALIALSMAHQEPLVLPNRADVERRLDATIAFWRGWTQRRTIPAGRREASVRSALALKLLVHSPTGAVAAAATTSLPEEIGGERNWDYRFSWLRDSAFVMEALLALGCRDEAEAFFWWLMHASQITQPRLQVLYRLDGSARAAERTLPLEGYKGSTPVRVGNLAAEQHQLDIYGDLLQTAWLYAQAGHGIDREFGDRLAAIADLVTEIWREPDAGIWEVRGGPRHFTQSKMLCWVALDRARRLADDGYIPAGHTDSWRTTAEEIETLSKSVVGPPKWAATHRRSGAKPWTRACCSERDSATEIPRDLDSAARSQPCSAISRRECSCIATAATTASGAGRAPSSAVRSGSRRSSP